VEIWLLALTGLLPILKLVLFPARTMGRGGNWTVIGAIMIVGLMMALWFGMQSLSDTVGATATAASPDAEKQAKEQQADLDSLAKLMQ